MTPFSVGLLGHGTVGSAFHDAARGARRRDRVLHRHAARVVRRPDALARRLRRHPRAQRPVVELIGGIEPARDYILRAIEAGKHVVTANKQVLSQHGEEIYEAARAAGVQLRFEAAVGGVVPVHPRDPRDARGRAHRPRARDRQRHDQLHPHAR